MNKATKTKMERRLKSFPASAQAAAKRLAALNHCSEEEMLARIDASARRAAAKSKVMPDIGVAKASEKEVLAATERLAQRDGCTIDAVFARVRASLRRVSRRSATQLHTASALLAGDRRRVSRFVGKVLVLAEQGLSRAEISSQLLRNGFFRV